METMETTAPVMVGVDGSTASIRAALWAAEEAAGRDTSLDLIYVVDPDRVENLDDAMAAARHAIHRTWETVTKSDETVKLNAEILLGNPIVKLTEVGRRAALLCLGHKGTKDSAPSARGSTAAGLLRAAPTSVAVVRRRHTHRLKSLQRWIVVALDESAESHSVLQTALDEAQLRGAPVLALTTWATADAHPNDASEGVSGIRAKMDRYLKEAHEDPADLQVCALPMPSDLATLLEHSASIEQLYVIGASRQDLVDQVTGERARKAMRGTNCSVLVVNTE